MITAEKSSVCYHFTFGVSSFRFLFC